MDSSEDMRRTVFPHKTTQSDSPKGGTLADKPAFSAPAADRWYIGEIPPPRWRAIRKTLGKAYEVYVATQRETRVYKSRNKREIERVVIPGLIFIRTTEDNLWNILLTYSDIHRFMLDRAASDRERGKRVFACISDEEMQRLRYVLDNAPNPVAMTAEQLTVGQQIEITRGPLAGLKGELVKKDNTSYLVLKMEMGERNYIMTEISANDVRPINEKHI